MEIKDERINEIIAELDDSVPREGAEVDIDSMEGRGLSIVANKTGFVRLARECLVAATAPLKPGLEVVQTNWEYLIVTRGRGPLPIKISRTETVVLPPPPRETGLEKARTISAFIIGIAFLLFLLGSTVVGCFTILSKIK